MMHELSGKNFPAEEHPRLLLISSRVPAAEVGNFELAGVTITNFVFQLVNKI